MARYYFHLRAGDAYWPDLTGADLENPGESARRLMLMLERAGGGDYRGWLFEITDESGEFVDTMRVEDLVGELH
ncbi:MAG: DUF6894 family protein [Beijerinckiaceae bacterium]